mmetsp:Transcript_31367/g.107841  ORF Transcript_31367/g.107841 Transcript_31367/m.107841 type:complete len:326 (-) Transcript_31367:161-1138(-)
MKRSKSAAEISEPTAETSWSRRSASMEFTEAANMPATSHTCLSAQTSVASRTVNASPSFANASRSAARRASSCRDSSKSSAATSPPSRTAAPPPNARSSGSTGTKMASARRPRSRRGASACGAARSRSRSVATRTAHAARSADAASASSISALRRGVLAFARSISKAISWCAFGCLRSQVTSTSTSLCANTAGAGAESTRVNVSHSAWRAATGNVVASVGSGPAKRTISYLAPRNHLNDVTVVTTLCVFWPAQPEETSFDAESFSTETLPSAQHVSVNRNRSMRRRGSPAALARVASARPAAASVCSSDAEATRVTKFASANLSS